MSKAPESSADGAAHIVPPSKRSLRVAFIHPDLGIGGAERLVVDAAVGLEKLGHEVEIITSHHDPHHCFEPTRDGTLKVRHAKTSMPRTVLGAFSLPCAILRQLSLLFQLLLALFAFKFPGTIPWSIYSRLSSLPPIHVYDVFVVDQLSAIVPALRILTTTRVVFYCHFPDKDVGLSISRQKAIERGESGPGLARTLYRIPFDYLEEMTMGVSDKILVNSEFTSKQFLQSFFRLARIPRTVYPGIDLSGTTKESIQQGLQKLVDEEDKEKSMEKPETTSIKKSIRTLIATNDRTTLVSINRFEAKKNIALALDTFVKVQKEYSSTASPPSKLRLVLAGGYDYRVQDNVLTLRELQSQCSKYGLTQVTLFYNGASPDERVQEAPSSREMMEASVVFLPSVPYVLLNALLSHSQTRALLYTPTEEHFGIVPLEAMAAGLPVIATNSGGPTESVVDLEITNQSSSTKEEVVYSNPQGTGLLRRATPDVWAQATMDILFLNTVQREQIAQKARERVRTLFSRESMSQAFEKCLLEVEKKGAVRPDEGLIQWSVAISMFVLMMTAFVLMVRLSYAQRNTEAAALKIQREALEHMHEQLEAQKDRLAQSMASAGRPLA